MSRLGTCKFFVASCIAYKAERADFYAQLNIDDSPCYRWWMSFIIRWSYCFRLLMRAVNQILLLVLPIFEASHICQGEGRPAHNGPCAGGMNKHHDALCCWKQKKKKTSSHWCALSTVLFSCAWSKYSGPVETLPLINYILKKKWRNY